MQAYLQQQSVCIRSNYLFGFRKFFSPIQSTSYKISLFYAKRALYCPEAESAENALEIVSTLETLWVYQ